MIGVTNELAADASIYVKEPIRAGIGVFCHEMSHGLGLPDLYWTLKTEPMDINVSFHSVSPAVRSLYTNDSVYFPFSGV